MTFICRLTPSKPHFWTIKKILTQTIWSGTQSDPLSLSSFELLYVGFQNFILPQFKLLEEEEKEKRDEEERKERRRAKEKEKKLRRKERLRIKEKEKEEKCGQVSETHITDVSKEELISVNNEPDNNDNTYCEEQEHEETPSSIPALDDYTQEDQILDYDENSNMEFSCKKDGNQLFANDQSKHNRRRLKSWKDYQHDQPSKWSDRRRFEYGSAGNKPVPRYHSDSFEPSTRNGNLNGVNKPVSRSNGSRYNDRLHCCHNRTGGRYDPTACNCYQHTYYRPKSGVPEPDMDASKPYFRRNKYNNSNQTECVRERPKTKTITGNNGLSYVKKVWEPRSNLDSDDVAVQSADVAVQSADVISRVKLVSSPSGIDLSNCNIKDDNLKEPKDTAHIEPEPESGTTDLSSSSSNSNSDSCSSSLSEGDGNTSISSNTQNAESSSTSDSEDANHHSEVIKDMSPCIENSGELLSKADEHVVGSESCSQGNNITPPPLQAQNIHFPVFQPPTMGYYHQGPVPWTTGPANGLIPVGPLPHPNHYMFASPFAYGLNGNSHFVPYGVGGLQPLGPPLLNHGQLPVYPPVNGVKDQHTKVIPIKGEQHVKSEKLQNNAEVQNENTEKTQKGNTGFSLFHFGGPVDVSNGFKPEGAAESVKEEIANASSGDSCVVKDVEEYNLFAASNGIKFSLF